MYDERKGDIVFFFVFKLFCNTAKDVNNTNDDSLYIRATTQIFLPAYVLTILINNCDSFLLLDISCL